MNLIFNYILFTSYYNTPSCIRMGTWHSRSMTTAGFLKVLLLFLMLFALFLALDPYTLQQHHNPTLSNYNDSLQSLMSKNYFSNKT